MSQLGANALGEVLEPGRVADCYLGLHLDPADDGQAAGVLVVARRAAAPACSQPAGSLVYELVFLSNLTAELCAWPAGTWAGLGVGLQAAAGEVIAAWHGGHVKGLQLGELTVEEALALERPAMTYIRDQLASGSAGKCGVPGGGGCTPPAAAGSASASCSRTTSTPFGILWQPPPIAIAAAVRPSTVTACPAPAQRTPAGHRIV